MPNYGRFYGGIMKNIIKLLIIVSILTGCGVSASIFPIDKHQQVQSSERKPFKCYFVLCETTNNEKQGS